MRRILKIAEDAQNALVLSCFVNMISFFYITVPMCVFNLVFCFAVSALIRICARVIKQNFVSALCAVMLAVLSGAVYWFLKMKPTGILLAFGVFVWAMIFRYAKFVQDGKCASFWYVLLFVFSYVCGKTFYVKEIEVCSLICSILFLVLYLFLSGVYVNEKFIRENENVKNFPKERMRKIYTALLSIFCAVAVFAASAAAVVKVDNSFFTDKISDALHVLYEKLPKTQENYSRAENETFSGTVDYSETAEDFGIYKKNNEWIEKIGTVLSIIILFAAVCVFIIWILRKTVKTLMLSKKFGSDETEFILNSDKHENVFFGKKSKVEKECSESKKIRKMYKKYVLKNVRHIRNSDTPKIIEKNMEKSAEEITRIYEKVRYSNHECTKEDVFKMKNALK